MGVWDELVLACDLKKDAPQQVIDILKYLIHTPFDPETQEFGKIETPNHRFFDPVNIWQALLHGETVYFPGESFAQLSAST